MTEEGAEEIDGRSRGTPRIAGRCCGGGGILPRCAGRYAGRPGSGGSPRSNRLESSIGLGRLMDAAISGGVADTTPAALLGSRPGRGVAEARDTLEDVSEPLHDQEGLILRTSRGRMLGEPDGKIWG